MDATGNYHVSEQADSKRQILHVLCQMQDLVWQCEKDPVTEPDGLNSLPRIHMVEEEKQVPKVVP